MDEIALQKVLRKLGRTPVEDHHQSLLHQPLISPTPPVDETSREALRDSMRRDFQALLRQVAQVYGQLSAQGRKDFHSSWSPLEEQIDQAYRDESWAGFQAVLVEARALLVQAQPDDPPAPVREHWVYRAWSRLLEAEVWWVCCEREVAELIGKGVQRGSIYTRTELAELLNLPKEGRPEALGGIHRVKVYFDGTVVSGGADGNSGAG